VSNATHRYKLTHCPSCGCKLSAATNADHQTAPPAPGDYNVCIGCAEVLVFQPDMSLRLATVTDLIDLTPMQSKLLDVTQRHIRLTRK
jgi:hypothetical protein